MSRRGLTLKVVFRKDQSWARCYKCLLFVNDLPEILTNGIKTFADDTKIWGPVKTVEDLCRATSPDSANGHIVVATSVTVTEVAMTIQRGTNAHSATVFVSYNPSDFRKTIREPVLAFVNQNENDYQLVRL